MRRWHLPVVLCAGAALLLSGCGSDDDTASPPGSATSAPTGAATTTPAGGASSGDQGSGTATSGPAGATGSPATGGAAGPDRCHTGDLKLTITPGGGAAGHRGEYLVLTNVSGHSCTLLGYPGVSWVAGDDGKQVNDPFERSGGAAAKVTLPAGGAAHATLVVVNTQNYDDGECVPVQARGYRVYPPDETAAVFVSDSQTVCSAKGVGLGQVQPIAAGAHD